MNKGLILLFQDIIGVDDICINFTQPKFHMDCVISQIMLVKTYQEELKAVFFLLILLLVSHFLFV